MVMLTHTISGSFVDRHSNAARDHRAAGFASRDERSSDATLVRAIAEGDRRAMGALYARHNVRLYRFILRFNGNTATAEDLVSEVFLEVWRSAARFEGKSSVPTWLLAIARYKALSLMRHRVDEPLDERVAETVKDATDDPETATAKIERGAIVRKCLTQLPAAQREVMDLVYYHDKSVDEVAEIVGISSNTVKTRMFYARGKLAGLLKQAGVERAQW
jgi:RNA polymerase sigma-70 factor, ECF subfamily